MDGLNIAGNIVRLRHEKKITQERLAEFIGVTKASVSKWETGQSMPDIVILPRLAAFFDITVDELLGYVPQLSKEQIQKWYQEFAGKFAEGSFEAVMAETQTYVKKYYSCYPFLFQVCILWLNHFMLAEGKTRQSEILVAITGLCEHIKENCRDVRISDDVIVLQAMVHLQLGRTAEVVDALEEMSRPDRLMGQSGIVLVQAYKMAGENDKAESFMQISMYNSLLSLVGAAAEYISVHMDNRKDCETTIERIGKVEEIYHLGKLNPNLIAGFEYRAALCYAHHGQKEKSLAHIKRYVRCIEELFSTDLLFLHGDAYFNKIEEWFGQAQGGAGAPRSRQLVLEEVKYSLESPLFAFLKGETGFEILKKELKEIK
ncbi:MAG: helix-turn-helix transcriptional regulator [Lachnospiraceae bacterium]|jgi:Predicted transcriptional regulators|nr:helix-turn-helix transcriptional regulator [Lachnospiraceae bacterium]